MTQTPQHEPACTKEPVDIPKQRLSLVDRVQLDFDLEHPHIGQLPLSAFENTQLRTLRVQLEHMHLIERRTRQPVVKCRDRHNLFAVGTDYLQRGPSVSETVDRRVQRRTRRLHSPVERCSTSLPS